LVKAFTARHCLQGRATVQFRRNADNKFPAEGFAAWNDRLRHFFIAIPIKIASIVMFFKV